MHAFRSLLIAIGLAAFAVSGCARPPAPAPIAGTRADLDALAYKVAPTTTAPVAYSYATTEGPYRLGAGDKLRIVIYGQEGLTNTYAVDAGGAITLPLIGAVKARGLTPAELAAVITARLKQGYLREPYVAVEIESYRPFFILGEVTAPGQYPYVPNMTVESAVAIAGGFTPRAQRGEVTLTRSDRDGRSARVSAPLGTLLQPGDTVQIGERWF